MNLNEKDARRTLEEHGQEHALRFWDRLNAKERRALLAQISAVDFRLLGRLIKTWVVHEPPPETFRRIDPIPVIPKAAPDNPAAREALDAGEEALRAGRVGLLLVAGGQGTRLGFDGPKGAYPIGPITGKSLFAYHAEKIRNLQRRYGCVLPWYIMVSDANAEATRLFFEKNEWFGLQPGDVFFFRQRMVPCVDEQGKLLLETPSRLAANPNGHGGTIPAAVESGVIADARARGVDTLSYFQVDNWAVKVADPVFVGCHVARNAEMSSKVHRKNHPREPVGVHCLCDGVYRVIEYTVLDLYPQLLETDADGNVVHYAGNPAMHILDTGFIDRIYGAYDDFPWWRAHKKIPFVDDSGEAVKPERPNGYKFETFIFDALRFVKHAPVALEIQRLGEYTPIKSFEGDNSVVAARKSMRTLWAGWLEAAGHPVPWTTGGEVETDIEISPDFAIDAEEFARKAAGLSWDTSKPLAIGPSGETIR